MMVINGVDHERGLVEYGSEIYDIIRGPTNSKGNLRALMDAAIARGMSRLSAQICTDEQMVYFIGVVDGIIPIPSE